MITAFDATLALLLFADPSPRQYERVQRIHTTLAWLRASCEADGLPVEIVDMVLFNAKYEMIAGRFPLVGGGVMGTWRCWRCNAALVAQPCVACQGTGKIVRAPEWTGETVMVFCQRCRGAGQVMACPQECPQANDHLTTHTSGSRVLAV